MKSSSLSGKDRKATQGAGCIRVFGLVFALIGLVVTFFTGIRPTISVLQSQSWPEASCTVKSSEVKTHSGSDGSTYSIDIQYGYMVDGAQYWGSKYDHTNFSSSGYQSKRDIVDQYVAGSTIPCYYDQEDPSRSVIRRDFSLGYLVGYIPLVFTLFGLIFFKAGSLAKNKLDTALSAKSEPHLRDPDDDIVAPTHPRGRAIMQSETSPTGRAIGLLIIAIFWNGIVSVFLYQVYKSWLTGSIEYFLIIFLLPFVAVGLALIAGFFHSLIALRNPRIQLEVHSLPWRLGDKETISWSFHGSATRIKTLRFTLKGQEVARYRQGTDTKTATETFFSAVIKETRNSVEIPRGSMNFELPAASVPTFKSGNNEIVWRIEVKGEIDRAPDISEQFAIEILPAIVKA